MVNAMKELIAFAIVAILTVSTGALAFAGAASPAAACAVSSTVGGCGG
jgi:hypothetical protein